MVGILELNSSEWLAAFKRTVGRKNSHSFIPLPDDAPPLEFESLLRALLVDEPMVATREIAALDARGIRYAIVRISDQRFGPIWGFMERVQPGEPDYHGWGAALVRPGGHCHTVYQAPHPQSDSWTDNLALQAFVDDAHAAVALFAGTNRYANGRKPASADVAHTTNNLFHALTSVLARSGRSAGAPYWFVQIHGSSDRPHQPVITASHGAIDPELTPSSPLTAIQRQVQAQRYVTIGVCEPSTDRRPSRAYLLCGTGNIQGRLLERMGLRHTFLHLEIAQSARSEYRREHDPGHAAIHGLLAAARQVLSQPPPMRATR